MLFGHLLTGTAQIFSDVRTYWSPEAVKRVTGAAPKGAAEAGFIHLINSGSTALDGTGQMQADGKPAMKPFWEITPEEAKQLPRGHAVPPRRPGLLPRRRLLHGLPQPGRHAGDHVAPQLVKGLGPVLQIAEGYTVELPEEVHDALDRRTNPTWPTTWFVPRLDRDRAVPRRVLGHERLGRQPRGGQLRAHRGGPDHPGLHAAHPGVPAQRGASRPSGPAPGPPSAWTRKGPTTAPAPPTGRCTASRQCTPGGSCSPCWRGAPARPGTSARSWP